jgi:hypothetical protein
MVTKGPGTLEAWHYVALQDDDATILVIFVDDELRCT